MKIIIQSLIGAAALYGIYIISMLITGYIQTRNYTPDFEEAWTNVENLPKEVAFGQVPSPFLQTGVFLFAALACGALLVLNKRFASSFKKQ